MSAAGPGICQPSLSGNIQLCGCQIIYVIFVTIFLKDYIFHFISYIYPKKALLTPEERVKTVFACQHKTQVTYTK